MKEFIDKLIARLKEKADCHRERGFLMEQTGFSSLADKQYAKQTTFLDAIEIVNQLAEEYKGGWISCDKELPTTEGTYWATLHDVQSGYEYVRRVHWNSFFKRWLWDNGKPLSNLIEVVAWQNIYRPEPYREGVRK